MWTLPVDKCWLDSVMWKTMLTIAGFTNSCWFRLNYICCNAVVQLVPEPAEFSSLMSWIKMETDKTLCPEQVVRNTLAALILCNAFESSFNTSWQHALKQALSLLPAQGWSCTPQLPCGMNVHQIPPPESIKAKWQIKKSKWNRSMSPEGFVSLFCSYSCMCRVKSFLLSHKYSSE